MSKSKRKIGVFVCHCGGNISDYVDVNKVVDGVTDHEYVTVARTHMFTCSDAAQQEMIDDIKESHLDGLVIASCSPKLHMYTFREMADRAGLNPYQYVQVNLREQCSWAHTDDKISATEKGIELVKAGIAKCAGTVPLKPIRIETKPIVLVIGGGITGLKTARMLSGMGLTVFIIEKEKEVGGHITNWDTLHPLNKKGIDVISAIGKEILADENITLYKNSELIKKDGTIGDFNVCIKTNGSEEINLNVGSIIVATGFDNYAPGENEFGYGNQQVITLPEFKKHLNGQVGNINFNGKEIKNIAYIYCVGSRQKKSDECAHPNTICSRYCCTATAYTASAVSDKFSGIRQYHFFRDIRTYGRNEDYYEQAREGGSLFLRYDPKEPPLIENKDGKLMVRCKDSLTSNEEIAVDVDLVVLVTGMVPRTNDGLTDILKLPLDQDGFYKEIHLKLRPVETVIDGVFIAGVAQGPKLISETVQSGLSAVSKAASLLLKGYVDLEPLIAKVYNDRCTGCNDCIAVCPYNAIQETNCDGKKIVTVIDPICKGCGACVPVCNEDALEIEGYTDEQIIGMINAFATKETNGCQ